MFLNRVIYFSFFISLFFVLTSQCVYSSNNFQQYNSSPKPGKTYYYQPNELRISRKNYTPKSSLQNKFIFRVFNIKNLSDESIELNIQNNTNLNNAILVTEQDRQKKQSKLAFLEPLHDAKEDANSYFGANNGLCFVAGIASVTYNYGIKFPLYIGKSFYNSIASPYYFFNNQKDNELLKKDTEYLNTLISQNDDKYILKPQETIQIRKLYDIKTYPFVTAQMQNGTTYKFYIK